MRQPLFRTLFFVIATIAVATWLAAAGVPWDAPGNANPILPGYYADPSVLSDGGKHYMYATIDPWGGETLGAWESTDFRNWTYKQLNWPTKKACTSPTSKDAMVWAPSVVKGPDGKFHMFVSVGSEVWTGVADHPLGPWRDAHGGTPLIPATWNTTYHMIDAEAFVDTDGQAYLYWGSGWNWVNGHCFAVKLRKDMAAFDGEPLDVTPRNYFEGPFMVKHGSRYYLMYSNGKTIEENYRVHYATGSSPLGPFTEAPNSPILVSDAARNILSPGHHAVFSYQGHTYIAYHRHSVPFVPDPVKRQVCVDEMRFTADGLIEKVATTHEAPEPFRRNARSLATGAVATASSTAADTYRPAYVLDDNYATRWAPAPDAKGAWLQMDLGGVKDVKRNSLRFEYAWKPYRFTLLSSRDGQKWDTVQHAEGVSGSPIEIAKPVAARYLRLTFPADVKGADISIFEWQVF